MNSKKEQLLAFERLLTIMDDLREKCPWDKKQTLQSLRHLTIEETYELGDAILDNDLNEVKKELGDLLLHIVFYAKIGSETNDFDMADVCNEICNKLIHRHPHMALPRFHGADGHPRKVGLAKTHITSIALFHGVNNITPYGLNARQRC